MKVKKVPMKDLHFRKWTMVLGVLLMTGWMVQVVWIFRSMK